MPFQRTKLDYLVSIMFLTVFIYAFFFLSTFGDLHYFTPVSKEDPALYSYVNLGVILFPLILFYEMLQLFVLPGKPRLREFDKRFYLLLFFHRIRRKLEDGIEEYHQWRRR